MDPERRWGSEVCGFSLALRCAFGIAIVSDFRIFEGFRMRRYREFGKGGGFVLGRFHDLWFDWFMVFWVGRTQGCS